MELLIVLAVVVFWYVQIRWFKSENKKGKEISWPKAIAIALPIILILYFRMNA